VNDKTFPLTTKFSVFPLAWPLDILGLYPGSVGTLGEVGGNSSTPLMNFWNYTASTEKSKVFFL